MAAESDISRVDYCSSRTVDLLRSGSRVIDLSRFVVVFFFFQAEDGIRDLVRSRGLGDVYKRQVRERRPGKRPVPAVCDQASRGTGRLRHDARSAASVSYTHLTLPTIYSV